MSEIYKKGNNIVSHHTLCTCFFFFLGGGERREGLRVGCKYSRINEVETVSHYLLLSRSSSDRIQDQTE